MKKKKILSFFIASIVVVGNISMSAYAQTLEKTETIDNLHMDEMDNIVQDQNLSDEQIVRIDADNFPDALFRTYVSEHFDTDSDGSLDTEEINNAVKINVSATYVEDLSGIELLTNLHELECGSTRITEIDISNNTALEILDCNTTNITKLDVSNNLSLEGLECNSTHITELNVKNNPNLKTLNVFDNRDLTSLDISSNPELEYLNCGSTGITELDISHNLSLVTLDINVTDISKLDVRNHSKLQELDCIYTRIAELDVSQNLALTRLMCKGCPLAVLELGENDKLELYMDTETTVSAETGKEAFHLQDYFPTIDVDHISSFQGAILDGSVVKEFSANTPIIYTYECGNGKEGEVTLTVTLNVSSTYEPPQDIHFSDVSEQAWYYNAVKEAVELGIMAGTTNDTFSPDSIMTRGMVATVLYRMADSPEVVYEEKFTDVPDGMWFTDGVLWANNAEVVYGYHDRSFGTDDNITREQMAVMMYRYALHKGYDIGGKADISQYYDAACVSSYATEALQWAVGNGIITGKAGGYLDPQGNATRAECAAIIVRFVNNYEG